MFERFNCHDARNVIMIHFVRVSVSHRWSTLLRAGRPSWLALAAFGSGAILCFAAGNGMLLIVSVQSYL